MNVDRVPESLRRVPQWVVWKYIDRDGKQTKCPFSPDGTAAKSNDAETWACFDEAVKAFNGGGYEGLGFMFDEADPFCGIDLDGCRDPESGTTQQWARYWLEKCGSYCEVSPSGTGWKIFCQAKSKFSTGKKHDLEGDPINGKAPGVELYDRLRWFAVTGLRGKFKDVVECQSAVNEFCDAYWKPQSQRPGAVSGTLDGEVFERARRYVAKMPPAVSGQSGHNAAFKAACVLVLGFGLTPEQAYPIFVEYNATCDPPWSEREIWHKLNSANKQPGDRFYLRNVQESDWSKTKVPDYQEKSQDEKQAQKVKLTTLKEAADEYLDQMAQGNALIDLGIPEISEALEGGVARGEMVIFAARPSHGKSAFALQCLHQCSANGMPCLMVSEEMSTAALGKRTVQYVSGVDHDNWMSDRKIVDRHLESHFSKRAGVYIAESCRTAQNVEAAIKNAVAEHDVSVVAVDYAQLLTGKGNSSYERVSYVSRELRRMANEYNILLLVLCQLSRECETRTPFVPKMTDLRDSGQLEQDADVILFLVWKWRVDHTEDPNLYQVFVGKNRNRSIVHTALDCHFNPTRQQFTEIRREPTDLSADTLP